MNTPENVPEGLCQEADASSTFMYVACGAPATTLVHSDVDNYTYRMCDMCASHNINNRGLANYGPYTAPGSVLPDDEATAEGWASVPEVVVEAPTYPIKYPGQPATEEPEAFRLRRNAEIQRWMTAKETLVGAKDDEGNWRNKVTATLFPTPKKGTQRYELGGGYNVKLQYVLTYSIGNKDLQAEDGSKISVTAQVEALENKIAEMGEAHLAVFEGIVSWKPEISGSAYEKLNAENAIHLAVRNEIDKLLTIKPGAPQLVFEEPKPAKDD